jgi:ATP/maltotriose-dependent transcriptional regulator MalT
VALLAATGWPANTASGSISKRTVDTHLDRIYRKLGVAGRRAAEA